MNILKPKQICIILIIVMTLIICSACKYDNSEISLNSLFTENEIKTLESIKKIDDYPLYLMSYEGDYGFDDFLKVGLKIDKNKEQNNSQNCSCIAMYNDNGNAYFGRNLDWHNCPILVLYTNPPNAYASISVVDLVYLGFSNQDDITKMNLEERKSLLSAPYLTFDGMNEYGVCIGEMTLAGSKPPYDSNKVTLGSLSIMRTVLDYAKNTEEAINLFNKYNVVFNPPSPTLHYLVSDPSGDSAVIEFIDGDIKITRKSIDEYFQICTNTRIFREKDEKRNICCSRYNKAFENLSNLNGSININSALDVMKLVSQGSTQWSSVYDMINGDVKIVVGRNYSNPYSFKINIKPREP